MTYSVERLAIAKMHILRSFQKKYPEIFPEIQEAFEEKLSLLFKTVQTNSPEHFKFSDTNPEMSEFIKWVHASIGAFPRDCSVHLSFERDFTDQNVKLALSKAKAKENIKKFLPNYSPLFSSLPISCPKGFKNDSSDDEKEDTEDKEDLLLTPHTSQDPLDESMIFQLDLDNNSDADADAEEKKPQLSRGLRF